jgi:ribosomal protein L16 Arg81 hydroxylase
MIAKVWSTEQNGEPVINTTLQSGDVVFVPANVYHQIIPLTKRLSVSFPMAHYDKSFQERDWITL